MSLFRGNTRILYLALLLALFLMLVPLPEAVRAWRLPGVSLVLIYWSLQGPKLVTLGFAFALGLLADVMTASLLGMHALQWVVLVFLVARFSPRIRFSTPLKQTFTVFLLLLNERFLLLWILLLAGENNPGLVFWAPALLGALVWPWFFVLMSRFQLPAIRK